MHRLDVILADHPGKRGLSRLARPDQCHDGIAAKTFPDGLEVNAAADVHFLEIITMSFRITRKIPIRRPLAAAGERGVVLLLFFPVERERRFVARIQITERLSIDRASTPVDA